MDFRFCFVVQAQLYQSATRLEQNTAMRLNLWAIGYGLLVIGYWVIGYWVGVCDCTINYLLALRAEIL